MILVKCEKCGRIVSAGEAARWERTEGDIFYTKGKREPARGIDLCHNCCVGLYQFINAGTRKMIFGESVETEQILEK